MRLRQVLWYITGAANGMGRAAAMAFAREGVSVVAADRSEPGNQETARMIEQAGGHALAVQCDVSRADDSDVDVIPIQQVNEAYERLLKSDVKYRFCIDMASLKSE